jgi:hypothetical protein
LGPVSWGLGTGAVVGSDLVLQLSMLAAPVLPASLVAPEVTRLSLRPNFLGPPLRRPPSVRLYEALARALDCSGELFHLIFHAPPSSAERAACAAGESSVLTVQWRPAEEPPTARAGGGVAAQGSSTGGVDGDRTADVGGEGLASRLCTLLPPPPPPPPVLPKP